MGPYMIPRNTKGEGRILFIFSRKSLIYTTIGAGIGFIFYMILSWISMGTVGLIIIASWGILGFIIGTFKIPDISTFKFTQNVGGENIDEIIKRAIKFKIKNKNKIYVYKDTKEEEKNDWTSRRTNYNINSSVNCNDINIGNISSCLSSY